MKYKAQLARFIAPAIAFLSAVLLGSTLALGLVPYITTSGIALACSILFAIRYSSSSSTEIFEPWLRRRITIHAAASIVLALVAGYWITNNAIVDFGPFSLCFSIIAGILAIGLRDRKQWIPVSFLIVYSCLMLIPIGTTLYMLLGNPFYDAIIVPFYLLLICLPSLLLGYAMLRTTFRDCRHRVFVNGGIFRFGLASLFVWITIAFLVLLGGWHYAKWLLNGGPMKTIADLITLGT